MLPIQKKFVKYNYSKRSVKPKYIVIHDTGNPLATALNHYNYFNGGNRGASADFFVDSNNIIQIVDTDVNYSWAVGDGKGAYGITNSNSCSIEMCLEKDGKPSEATIQNTVELTKYLMGYYNIDFGKVVRHYDASRKNCPQSLSSNNWSAWYDFKARLAGKEVEVNIPVVTTPQVDSVYEKAKSYNKARCLELQQKLNKVGGYGLAEDNIYGKATHKALGDFQGKNGLTVDFLAGNATFSKLDQLIAKKNSSIGNDWIRRLQKELNVQKFRDKNGNVLAEDGILGEMTVSAFPVIKYGSKGNITKLVQELLNSKGYNTNGIDGLFYNGSVSATKQYQKDRKVSIDGAFGKECLRVYNK